ncbi:hypothetical protein ACOMHN_000406 [Nucella lapillus]
MVMAIGVLVEMHRQKMQSMNNQLALPVALLILVGLIITLNAICGLIGTLAEHVTLLKVFLVVTIIAFLMQMSVGVLAFIHREDVPEIMEDHLRFAVSTYGEDVSVTRAMNYLQTKYKCCLQVLMYVCSTSAVVCVQYKCCGLLSYVDYSKHNKDYRCESGKPQACGVPSSCCTTQTGKVQPTCGYGVVGNLTVSDKVYIVGCINSFMHWLTEHLDLTGAFGLGFAIPQIIGILLVYYFIRRVNDYQRGYRVGQYLG